MFQALKHEPAPIFFKIGLALAVAAVSIFFYFENVREPNYENRDVWMYLLFSIFIGGISSPVYLIAGLVYFLMFHFRRPTHAQLNFWHFCLTFGGLAAGFLLFHFRLGIALQQSPDLFRVFFSTRLKNHVFADIAPIWLVLLFIWALGQLIFLGNVIFSLAVRQTPPPENPRKKSQETRPDILDA